MRKNLNRPTCFKINKTQFLVSETGIRVISLRAVLHI